MHLKKRQNYITLFYRFWSFVLIFDLFIKQLYGITLLSLFNIRKAATWFINYLLNTFSSCNHQQTAYTNILLRVNILNLNPGFLLSPEKPAGSLPLLGHSVGFSFGYNCIISAEYAITLSTAKRIFIFSPADILLL